MNTTIASLGSSETVYNIDANFYNKYCVNKDQVGVYRLFNLNKNNPLHIYLPNFAVTDKLNKYSFIRDNDDNLAYSDADYYIIDPFDSDSIGYYTQDSKSCITFGNFGSDYPKISSNDELKQSNIIKQYFTNVKPTQEKIPNTPAYSRSFTFDNVSKNCKFVLSSSTAEASSNGFKYRIVEVIDKTKKNMILKPKLDSTTELDFVTSKNGAKIEVIFECTKPASELSFRIEDTNGSVYKTVKDEISKSINLDLIDSKKINTFSGKIVTVNISGTRGKNDFFSFASRRAILNENLVKILSTVDVTHTFNKTTKTSTFKLNATSGSITLMFPSRRGNKQNISEEKTITIVPTNPKSSFTVNSIYERVDTTFSREFQKVLPGTISDEFFGDVELNNSGTITWNFVAPSSSVNLYFASNSVKDEAILSIHYYDFNGNKINVLENPKNYTINSGITKSGNGFMINENLENTSNVPNMIIRNLNKNYYYYIVFGTSYNDNDTNAVFDDVQVCMESSTNDSVNLFYNDHDGVIYGESPISISVNSSNNITPVISENIKINSYQLINGIPTADKKGTKIENENFTIILDNKTGKLNIQSTAVVTTVPIQFGIEFKVNVMGVMYEWYSIEVVEADA